MLKLSIRLEKAYNAIKKCGVFADIGTDHGLLPIAVLSRGKALRGVASDLRSGPLVKCKANIERSGLIGSIDLRQGYGLDPLSSGEADSIAVCGMGGLLICEIIEKGLREGRLKAGTQLVLSPNTHEAEVRRLLSMPCFERIKETAVREAGQIYMIISCYFNGFAVDIDGPARKLTAADFTGSGVLPKYYYRKVLNKAEKRAEGLRAGSGVDENIILDELRLMQEVISACSQKLN